MPTRKTKRKYVKDLIKVATKDIKKSVDGFADRAYAFGDQDSCPIATSLKRHGHEAWFNGYSELIIDGTIYRVPSKMVKWQKGGVSGRRRTLPFKFRISELEVID